MTGSCVSVLNTGNMKELGCQYEVRAKQIPGMPVFKITISLLFFFSLSLSLRSDYAVSAMVEDASGPLSLYILCLSTFEHVSHTKSAI